MRTVLALGLRVAWSPTGRGRFATFTVVGAVVCACLMIVLAVMAVKDAESDRYSRQGDPSELADRGLAVTPGTYRGRSVTLVQVPSNAGAGSLPPGLQSPLAPGAVRLSPALAARVDDDPVLARWFPYERGAVLPVEAVNAAGEYRAYIGVASRDHVPGTAPGAWTYTPEFASSQRLAFVLFVGLPAVGLLAMSARFGRRIRRERLAGLRLLGMSTLHCRGVLAIETGLPIALGSTVVAVAVSVLRPRHVVLPVVDRWVFGADARLGGVTTAAVAGAVAVAGFVVGASTRRERATGRLRGLVARGDPARVWAAIVYAGGVGLLAAAYIRATPRDPLRFWGVVAAGAGITGAVTYLGGIVGRLLTRSNAPTTWFIAMRKLSADPRTNTRLAGIVGVVAFVIGVSQPAAQLIAQPSSTWVDHARAAEATSVAGWSWSVPGATLSPPGDEPVGTRVALPAVGLWRPGQGPSSLHEATALVASCDDLESLVGARLPACDGSVQSLQVTGPAGTSSGPPWQGTAEIRGDGGELVATATPASTIAIPYGDEELIDSPLGPNAPVAIVPPATLPEGAQPLTTGLHLRTDATVDAWEDAKAWVMTWNPSFYLQNRFEGLSAADSTVSWLVLGFGFVAGVAFVGASLSTLEDRRSVDEWTALRALGMGAWSLIGVRTIVAAVSGAVAVIVAIVPALLVTYAYLRVIREDPPSLRPLMAAATITMVTVLVVTFTSAALQARKLARPVS